MLQAVFYGSIKYPEHPRTPNSSTFNPELIASVAKTEIGFSFLPKSTRLETCSKQDGRNTRSDRGSRILCFGQDLLQSRGTKRQTFPICFLNLLTGRKLLLSEKKNSDWVNSEGGAHETLTTCCCVLHLHTCTWKWHVRALGGLWCVAPTEPSLRRGRCNEAVDQRGRRD